MSVASVIGDGLCQLKQASAKVEREITSLRKNVTDSNEEVIVLRKNLEEASAKVEQEIISLRKIVTDSHETVNVLRNDLEEASSKNTKLEQEIISLRKRLWSFM